MTRMIRKQRPKLLVVVSSSYGCKWMKTKAIRSDKHERAHTQVREPRGERALGATIHYAITGVRGALTLRGRMWRSGVSGGPRTTRPSLVKIDRIDGVPTVVLRVAMSRRVR